MILRRRGVCETQHGCLRLVSAPSTEKPVLIALRLRERGWSPYKVSFAACASAWIALSLEKKTAMSEWLFQQMRKLHPARSGRSKCDFCPATRAVAAGAALLTVLRSTLHAQAFETAGQLARSAKGSGKQIRIPGTKGAPQCWGYMTSNAGFVGARR